MLTRKYVIVDTNVLLMVYEGIDVFERIEDLVGTKCKFIVPNSVIDELIRLSLRPGPKGKAARLAIQYIRLKGENVMIISSIGKRRFTEADEEILELVKNQMRDALVVTNDDELKSQLKKLGVTVITWWFSKGKFTYA